MAMIEGSDAKAPRVPNAPDRLGLANEKSQLLVERLENLANRLCGSVPQAANEGLRAVSNGLLDQMMDQANGIVSASERGLDALNRIERSLP